MRWVLVVAISVASIARAHDADVIYALVEQHGDAPNALVERLTMTAATLTLLAPVDLDGDGAVSQGELEQRQGALRVGVWDDIPLTAGGVRCTFLDATARVRDGFVELAARFDCPPGELRQEFRLLRVLPANYRVVLGSQTDGERAARGIAQGSFFTIPVPRPAAPGAWDQAGFLRAFDDGLARAFSLEALACVAALMFSLAAWRAGLLASALLIVGVIAGSFFSWPWWLCSAVALSSVVIRPHAGFALSLGFALGAREGGMPLANALGLGAGTLVPVVPAAIAFVAIGVMLGRRAGWKRPARWGPVVVALLGVIAARLS